MKERKRSRQTEINYMESDKYIDVLVTLNEMVRRFHESLVLIKEQQARAETAASAGLTPDSSNLQQEMES